MVIKEDGQGRKIFGELSISVEVYFREHIYWYGVKSATNNFQNSAHASRVFQKYWAGERAKRLLAKVG